MGQGYPGTACNGENFGQFDFNAHFGQDSQCPHFHSNVRRLILINDRYRICTILVRCLIRTPDTKIHHMLAVFLPTCFLITTFPQRHQNISDWLQFFVGLGITCNTQRWLACCAIFGPSTVFCCVNHLCNSWLRCFRFVSDFAPSFQLFLTPDQQGLRVYWSSLSWSEDSRITDLKR